MENKQVDYLIQWKNLLNTKEELMQDEAMGHEGGFQTHTHIEFTLTATTMKTEAFPEKDCEEMEYACGKAGIKCKCEPDEMRQGGVIIHTMAPVKK